MRVLFLLTISSFFFFKNNISNNFSDPVTIRVTCQQKEHKLGKDLWVDLLITNNQNRILQVADELYFGFAKDSSSEVVFEVKKVEGNKYITQRPTGDYNYFYDIKHKNYLNLQKNDSHTFPFLLSTFYTLSKGKYCVRAKYIVPEINKINKKFIYSIWEQFEVK